MMYIESAAVSGAADTVVNKGASGVLAVTGAGALMSSNDIDSLS